MIRTRFAPSPTGYLHIGGVRTALFNWLFARRHGGAFILRIDDTDRLRNIDAALAPILNGFRWLGIDWDEGPEIDGPHAPYYQSQRDDRYQQAVGQLLESGFAYRDYARPEEEQAERDAAMKENRAYVYSRKWMAESDEDAVRFEAEGRTAKVRMKMPREGACQFFDHVRGHMEFAWDKEQDVVIQKSDGAFLYNLASVVDDQDFKISHVIRSVEHLSNTPRQIYIAQSLGYTLPEYVHLPYVAEPGGSKKLSKRNIPQYLKNPQFKQIYDRGREIAEAIKLPIAEDTFNPVIVDFYEQIGFLPEAVVNYLLLLGWSLDDKTEDFTRQEMINHFSLERIVKSPASFDTQKMTAFQARYFARLPIKQKVAMVLPYVQKAGYVDTPPSCDAGPRLRQIVEAAGDRLVLAADILDYDYFYLPDDELTYDSKAFEKRLRKPDDAADLLAKFKDVLANAESFDVETLEKLLKQFVEDEGIKVGQIIHALRVAVTGKAVGFGMYDTLAILGKERCVARIDVALQKVADE